MDTDLHLDDLPRTIELARDEAGRPQFVFIDQRRLPAALVFERTDDWHVVVDAIKTLAVRGAPAIGVSGAAAVALWAAAETSSDAVEDQRRFLDKLDYAAAEIETARPTAVNLAWGVRRVVSCVREALEQGRRVDEIADALFDEVKRMEAEDEAANRAIGAAGAELLAKGSRVLTHCNAGSLATVFYGTALGVVYAAAEQGKIACVFADETRPVGQGARLTAWELSRVGIPVTLLCDSMAASVMAAGKVDAVIVGADRICANGDAANKIGTYGLAVLANHHGIPFYVAAPTSTIDFGLTSGSQVPIEQRAAAELGYRIPEGVDVFNPAFDVTPAALIDAIVTEQGVFAPDELHLLH